MPNQAIPADFTQANVTGIVYTLACMVDEISDEHTSPARALGRAWRNDWEFEEYYSDVRDAVYPVVRQLQDEGWVLLGNGQFSVALMHPELGDRVLKLSLNPDDSGPIWWDYCAKHQGEPFVPVQYAHGEVLEVPFVLMDRLEVDTRRAEKYTRVDHPDDLACLPESYVDLVHAASCLGGLDIHDENVMFHPVTGEAFLTDPIY